MTTEKPNACPFCGVGVLIINEEQDDGFVHPLPSDCVLHNFYIPAWALAQWNTRVGIAGLDAELAQLRATNAELLAALDEADSAIKEIFRYYDGGEMRGSYDGKPERNQLRKAGRIVGTAITRPKGATP